MTCPGGSRERAITGPRSDDIITFKALRFLPFFTCLPQFSGFDTWTHSDPYLYDQRRTRIMFPFRPPFLSFSLVSTRTPNSRMDFTFGGKYHPEELAIGGCGSYRTSLPFCFVFLRSYGICLDRDRRLWNTYSGSERRDDRAGTGSGKATE